MSVEVHIATGSGIYTYAVTQIETNAAPVSRESSVLLDYLQRIDYMYPYTCVPLNIKIAVCYVTRLHLPTCKKFVRRSINRPRKITIFSYIALFTYIAF
jgi:hypothetical protein